MSEGEMRPNPSEMGINTLEQYGLTEAELKFCTPPLEGEGIYVHDMMTLFPELDTFISSIQDSELRDNIEKHIQYYRDHKGASGDILTSLYTLIEVHAKSAFFNFPIEIQKSPEFRALVTKYKRLSEARTAGMADKWEETRKGSMEFEKQEVARYKKRQETSSILPRLGVRGTFQTPGGAIRGTIQPGAPVGGPYIIKTPQGLVRVSKITDASY